MWLRRARKAGAPRAASSHSGDNRSHRESAISAELRIFRRRKATGFDAKPGGGRPPRPHRASRTCSSSV